MLYAVPCVVLETARHGARYMLSLVGQVRGKSVVIDAVFVALAFVALRRAPVRTTVPAGEPAAAFSVSIAEVVTWMDAETLPATAHPMPKITHCHVWSGVGWTVLATERTVLEMD